uniref:T9SS type A sorting domain-containing protein n=1 Tax=Eiseniibacteriota bacterium TaxID=2212470 RepID=A0A832I0R7_UNCEI
MRRPLRLAAATAALAALVAVAFLAGRAALGPDTPPAHRAERPGPFPSDWFGAQRAWPLDHIPQEKYEAAMEQARVERAAAKAARLDAGLVWEQAGPFNIGGRVTALAVAPGGTTVYLGAAAGGVFKSVNSGVNWTPVFDATGVFSIGALALKPGDPNTLLVGTGEANASVDSYDGSGLWRTTDGGATWSYLGLAETRRIARVAYDPQNPDRIFVAAMGGQFSTGPHRGLYRSEDGGATWSKVLFVNDSTGVCDVVLNPAHPETMYCATWERIRRPSYRRAYGPGSGVWKSVDGGTSWTRLSGGLPAPSDSVGRIALGLAASRPSTIYAQIVGGANLSYNIRGLYRSTDAGQTWQRRDYTGGPLQSMFGGFGWYFGDLGVDPTDPDRIFPMGVTMQRSADGGLTYTDVTNEAHVDFHALWIDPANPQRLYAGSDGGFFWSTNGGDSWSKSLDLPITQYYAGTVDPTNPAVLYGGTQDNGTQKTAGDPYGWTYLGIGGDGFQVVVDPVQPNVVFAEYQFGCYGTGPRRSTNGGLSFGSAPTGFVTSDRFNWNTPIEMNPLNHNVLLVGSHRVYRSTNNGLSYSIVSPNLTTDPVAQVVYGTITTLAISPADTNTYYAGTDDGQVWRSTDRGGSWSNVSGALPDRYVTRVVADPVDPAVVYVTLSGFGLDERLAHVYRSPDRGDTWTSIAGNLPDIPANDLIVDPADPQTLFLATDVGVYATRNGGAGWFPLGAGMPAQTVFDLTFHAPSRTLVAATHGRSQWRLDLTALPVAVAPRAAAPALALAPPAPNPARGAVTLAVELGRPARLEVAVFDAMGRRVRVLESGAVGAGRRALTWDGRDAAGRRAGAGVYFVRAEADGALATARLVRVD